jgi:hypothetical protein
LGLCGGDELVFIETVKDCFNIGLQLRAADLWIALGEYIEDHVQIVLAIDKAIYLQRGPVQVRYVAAIGIKQKGAILLWPSDDGIDTVRTVGKFHGLDQNGIE